MVIIVDLFYYILRKHENTSEKMSGVTIDDGGLILLTPEAIKWAILWSLSKG